MKKLLCAVFVFIISTAVYAAAESWASDYIFELCGENVARYDAAWEEDITRGEFVEYVIKMMGAKPQTSTLPFKDAPDAGERAPYIAEAVRLGIVSGFNDGTFRPEAGISREEATVILSRAFGFLSGYSANDDFADFREVSDAAKSAVAYACRKGIVSGYPDGLLHIKNPVTRAEAAVMLCRARANKSESEPGFVIGYPRLSQKGIYGCISVDIVTNMPCVVYCTLRPTGSLSGGESFQNAVATVTAANRAASTAIVCDAGKVCDVYLTAVAADGRCSRTVCIESAASLPYTEGDGTRDKPYGIYNAVQLDTVRYFSDRYFEIKEDIALSGIWEPIGDFSGVLDGGGHRITGIRTDSDAAGGLFARISRGEVKNLTVDVRIKAHKNAGAIAGETGNAKITACVACGTVSAATNNAGGLVGENAGVIDNCLSAVYVAEAGAYAGGICGQNYGSILNSVSAAHSVSADMYAGGIAAVNSGGRIEKCISADIYVFDMMMDNCGRIAVNKKGGITASNLAYEGMKTTSDTDVNEADNRNGENVSWEILTDKTALCAAAGLDEQLWAKSEEYLIMYPSQAAVPELLEGICEYAPVRISTAAELLGIMQNPDRHYMLTSDIYLDPKIPWTPVGGEEGFSGSLDGGGHTIYNLSPEADENGVCAMFTRISDGVVRRLTISDAIIRTGRLCGVLAGENYGTITDCNAYSAKLSSSEAGAYTGGICGYNYGTVKNCRVSADMEFDGGNTVLGGICAHNEGILERCAFGGSIENVKNDGVAEAVCGGICGYLSDGSIYECTVRANIRQSATTMYTGGICAIASGGDIYKCESHGKMTSAPPRNVGANAYTGGVCALASASVTVNCYSDAEITAYSASGYTGGVCGYNEGSVVQCNYASGIIVHMYNDKFDVPDTVYAGGVCGYNEQGTVGRNMALCPEVKSGGSVGRICAGGDGTLLYSNYAISDMRAKNTAGGELDGTDISVSRIAAGFYTVPIADGGRLGWSDEIWQDMKNGYPALADMPQM